VFQLSSRARDGDIVERSSADFVERINLSRAFWTNLFALLRICCQRLIFYPIDRIGDVLLLNNNPDRCEETTSERAGGGVANRSVDSTWVVT